MLLAKSVLVPMGLTESALAVQKEIIKSGATLMISDKEMDDITKLVESIKDSGWLKKALTKKSNNKAKEQKRGFPGKLLSILSASLLGYMLAKKRCIEDCWGNS